MDLKNCDKDQIVTPIYTLDTPRGELAAFFIKANEIGKLVTIGDTIVSICDNQIS